MNANTVEIIIRARDAASSVVSGVMSRLNQATRAYNDTLQQFNGQVKESMQSLASMAARAGAVYSIGKAFQDGIRAVDEYRLSTISIAATLTDMAESGSGNLRRIYDDNLRYAQETYVKVEQAAARYFASGKEMIEAWRILTQKGVIVYSDADIDNLGIIVDKIKLATQGQASSLQIAQELRAAISGQVRPTDQIAMLLRDRLGPEWDKLLQKAREEGRLLDFLASSFGGLKIASGDVSQTLESQKSTLGTLLQQVGRSGLAGAYRDIVGILDEINGYLREHGEELASKIRRGWDDVYASISSVRDKLEEISKFSKDNPIASGWIGEFLKLSATVLLIAAGFRTLLNAGKWALGAIAANAAYLGTLFSGISGWLSGIFMDCVAIGGVWGNLAALAVAVGVAVAGWNLGKIINEWQIAGLKVREYAELVGLELSKALSYVKSWAKDVGIFLKTAWAGAGGAVKQAFYGLLAELADQPKTGLMVTVLFGDVKAKTAEVKEATARAYEAANAASLKNQQNLQAEISDIENEILLLKNLQEARRREAEGAADWAMGKPPGRPDEAPSPGIVPPNTEDAEALKERLRLSKEVVDAQIALEEARTRKSLTLIQQEVAGYEAMYARGKMSAADYYAAMKGFAERQAQVKIESLEKEKALIAEQIEKEKELAKGLPAEKTQALQLKWEAKLTGLDAEIEAQRKTLQESLLAFETDLMKFSKERVDAEVSVLREIVENEALSYREREEMAERYLDRRRKQIRIESSTMVEKGLVEGPLASQWETSQQAKTRDEILKLVSERVDAEVSALKEIADQEGLSLDVRRSAHEGYLQARLRQIEIEKEALRKKGVEETVIEQWTAAKIKEIRQDLRAYHLSELRVMLRDTEAFSEERARIWQEIEKRIERGEASMFEAISLGMRKAAEDFGSAAKQMADVGKTWITGMRDGFKTLFLAPFKGGVKDIQDWFAQFANAMMDKWAEMIANMIVQWLFFREATSGAGGGGFGGLLGGAIGWLVGARKAHQGAVVGTEGVMPVQPTRVFRLAPKLHDGLAGDEFPAILQTGEVVISRRDRAYLMSLLGGLGSGGTIAQPASPESSGERPVSSTGSGPTLNTNIVVNVPAGVAGQAAADPRASRRFGEEVGGVIRAKFMDMLREQMRPGGLLNQGLARG